MRARPRVIVCGTKFGRVYLCAFRLPGFPFELAGILAQGSERSRACAQYYQAPLFSHPDQLPSDIDIACVVVGAGVNGGRGAELARALMARGIHVLQEHPLHHDELVECLREARRNKVIYRLNTHYVSLSPVRRFVAAAQTLFQEQRCVFVDATAAFQTLYTLLDILGRTFGGLRPWSFAALPPLPDDLRVMPGLEMPYRSLDGVVAGVPFTLRVQNQMDPASPDNHSHIFHRITVGTASGTLTLVNTHGPVVWCPQPFMPGDSQQAVAIENSTDPRLELPSATPIGPVDAPSYREILSRVWPEGVAHALLDLRKAASTGEDSPSTGQYYLALSRLWQEITSRLGPLTLIRREPPPIFPVERLIEAGGREDEPLVPAQEHTDSPDGHRPLRDVTR